MNRYPAYNVYGINWEKRLESISEKMKLEYLREERRKLDAAAKEKVAIEVSKVSKPSPSKPRSGAESESERGTPNFKKARTKLASSSKTRVIVELGSDEDVVSFGDAVESMEPEGSHEVHPSVSPTPKKHRGGHKRSRKGKEPEGVPRHSKKEKASKQPARK